MIKVEVKDSKSLDKALKLLKSKWNKLGMTNRLRELKEFKKKSVKKRDQIKKAKYIQKLRDEEYKNS